MRLFPVRAPRPRMRALARAAALALAACALALASVTVVPASASAMTTSKLTAKPNGDSGSEVYGAKETRITWEGQAAADERVSAITLTLPDATSYTTDNTKVTVLSGADLMTREKVDFEVSSDGQKVTYAFDQPLKAGAYVRVELYGVEFPASGGDMQVKVAYATAGEAGDADAAGSAATGTASGETGSADGPETELADVPAVTVTGVSLTDQLSSYLKEQEWVQKWNSNTFLRLFLNPPILVSSIPSVFQGFLMALAIVLVAFPVAIPIGFMLALMRISRSRVLKAVSGFYVNIVRGTPAFLQIYIAFFGLPLAGVQIPSYPLGVAVMALNSSAYLCEIFRAGIQSIPKGQNEAARSLGMTATQTMLYVIIPQTLRNVLPTMTSEFILLYKDTSLLAAVGVMEVVMYAKTIVASTGSITPYIVAALFYLVVTLPLARVVGRLEARLLGTDAGSRKRKRPVKSAGEMPVIDGDHLA